MGTTGGNITLTAGLISQAVPIVITQSNTLNQGAGFSTLIQRTANMPTDQGLVNVSGASGVTIQNMAFDGGVTTATGVLRSTITSPIQPSFLTNTTIWVKGGTSDLTISNVKISHTGGYAIFLDARTGNIENVLIENCTFVNNRPFLFGATGGDLNYGSWLGGIFYFNNSDGSNEFFIKNLTIQNCTFLRSTGNQIWGACNNFETPNQNIQVINCQFEDTGLDAIELSNVNGATVSGNQGHRIGWIATDDTSPTVPKYDTDAGAVFIDTSSNVYNAVYENNTVTSITGQGFNLDGLYDSQVVNNTIQQPLSTDPLYGPDNIATCGYHGAPNGAVGIETGNTYIKYGGQHVGISGNTILNMGYSAIVLVNSKLSQITNNTIWHSGSAGSVPILIICAPGYDNGTWTDGSGSVGTTADAPYYRSHDTSTIHNRITYGADSPASNFCIAETDFTENSITYTYKSTDVNQVWGNVCAGTNYGEFFKDANSGSYTGREFHTNSNSSTSPDVSRMQREGTGSGAAFKTYAIVAGTGTQISQLSDAAFLNVGSGAATGNIATGARASSAWPDAMLSGKLYADAFLTLTDSTFLEADADLLSASYGLIRFDSSTNVFEVSTSVSAGVRVWNQMLTSSGGGSDVTSLNALVGSLTLAGASNQVTISPSGSTITIGLASTVTIAGSTGNPSLTLTNGYVYSTQGFWTPDIQSTAVNVPSGGGTFGLGVALGQALYLAPWSSTSGLNVPGGGYTALAYDAGSVFRYYNTTTPGWATVDFSTVGSGVTSLSAGTGVAVSGNTGSVTVSIGQAVASTNSPTFAGMTLTGPITVANGSTGTNITFQNTNNNFSVDVGGAISCAGVVTTLASFNCLGSASNSIQTAGGFSGASLTITGAASTQVLTINAGYMGSAQGYYSPGTTATAINIPSGGAQFGLGVQVNTGLWMAPTALGAGGLGPPTSGYGGFGYTGTAGNYWIWTGSTYADVNLAAIGGGVTSLDGNTGALTLTAGTGISISSLTISNSGVTSLQGTSGALTLTAGTGVSISGLTVSIGQDVSTTAGVTLNALFLSYTGPNALQTPGGIESNALFCGSTAFNAIATSGGIECGTGGLGGFYVGTSKVINASGSFVGPGGVLIGSVGIQCGGVNPFVGGVQYTGQDYGTGGNGTTCLCGQVYTGAGGWQPVIWGTIPGVNLTHSGLYVAGGSLVGFYL